MSILNCIVKDLQIVIYSGKFLPTTGILQNNMKNNTKIVYAVYLVACFMGLLSVDYNNISGLDIAVLASAVIAIIAIITNIIIRYKKGSQ